MWLFASWLGCAPDLTPTWAWDPIWLEPTEDGGAHGFETWQIHGPKWQRNGKDRYYVCGVVVALDGPAVDCDIEGCVVAFELTPTPVETDCPGTLADDPLFLSLHRLAIGAPAAGEVPWPGFTSETYADYGSGWEVYGQSWTEALDHGGAGQLGWNGTDPYQLVPDAAFPL
ncbi:MAG: hypothetical protein H6735_27235 [Alphaproteobacteria bacterium]|nr:hypothetical protein [Alphaproteobacteria bacterium]